MSKNTIQIENFNLEVETPDGSIVPVSDMSYDDLQLTRIHLEESISNIKLQIEEAKADAWQYDVYADPNWYRKASDALTIKKRQTQLLQLYLGKRNRERKQQKALEVERHFVSVCRERIDGGLFAEMMEAAYALYDGGRVA